MNTVGIQWLAIAENKTGPFSMTFLGVLESVP